MEKVFLDTGGILALVNKRDALHAKAVKENKKFEKEPILFVTTDYVLVEVGNGLVKHKSLAIKTLDFLAFSDDVQFVKISDKILNSALKIYKKYDDKEWGLTDISSFLVMRELGVKKAFTGDHHFEQFGFEILL